MIHFQVDTNLMQSQLKPAALRIAKVLINQQYDIECASLISSFLIACGVTYEEAKSLENADKIPTYNDLNYNTKEGGIND